MSVQNFGTSHRAESTVNDAIALARNLERLELPRCGTRVNAQRSLATKLRIGPGTVENLIRGRIKKIDATIRDRLQELIVKELQQEIARLQHELAVATQSSSRPDADEIFEVETHLKKARAVLTGIVNGKGKLNGNNHDNGQLPNGK